MDPNRSQLWSWKLLFEPYLQNCLESSAKVAKHPICKIPLSIRQLTRTPLYLVLFYVSLLNSSNTRSSIELRKKFNLISKNFLESGLSGIWRLNLNPAGSLRMSSQNSSELRNLETKGIVFFPISKIAWLCRTFYKTLLMFSYPFIKKLLSWMNTIIGLGHFFAVDYFGEIRRKTSTTF